jgi:site-specific recombinase XerD
MKIDNHSQDYEDNRTELPSNKNRSSFRSVALSSNLYHAIQDYILKYRRMLKRKEKMKLKHSYLFVSDQGRPMSIRNVQLMFEKLQKHIQILYKENNKICLNAHALKTLYGE